MSCKNSLRFCAALSQDDVTFFVVGDFVRWGCVWSGEMRRDMYLERAKVVHYLDDPKGTRFVHCRRLPVSPSGVVGSNWCARLTTISHRQNVRSSEQKCL